MEFAAYKCQYVLEMLKYIKLVVSIHNWSELDLTIVYLCIVCSIVKHIESTVAASALLKVAFISQVHFYYNRTTFENIENI